MAHFFPKSLAVIFVTLFVVGCSSPASSEEDNFVTIPGGTYTVGCDAEGNGCREVKVDSFEISKYEVTFAEWDECHKNGYCLIIPDDEGFGRGMHPVINVGLDEVREEFLPWKMFLNDGYVYSIPTADQYQAILKQDVDISCDTSQIGFPFFCSNHTSTTDIGSFPPDGNGIYDLYGNVGEWTSSRTETLSELGATRYWVFGKAWNSRSINGPFFSEVSLGVTANNIGFRLIRSIREE